MPRVAFGCRKTKFRREKHFIEISEILRMKGILLYGILEVKSGPLAEGRY